MANKLSTSGFYSRSAGLSIALALGCLLPVNAERLSTSAAPVQFSNLTKAAGITFVHFKGSNGISTILEEAGPGVAVADYDGDGYLDIYFANGRDMHSRGITARNALYRNNADGAFTDVTEKAAVPGTGYGLGCVWGDYDNDGDPDLYVTQYGRNVLYRNNGDGTFTDVTERAGVEGMEFGASFHSSATFFDYDHDGYLDLYVGSYVAFGASSRRTCMIGNSVPTSCPPLVYPGSPAILYHNNGNGKFANVTRQARMYQPHGKNLAVGAGDYDNDGWDDLFVANDGVEAYLYRNQHNGTFNEVGMTGGIAVGSNGETMAGMCISLGDFDNDGWFDLFISDFQAAPNRIFRNTGKGFFEEVSDLVGVAEATKNVLSFGGGFFDYDNDGWLDLFIANGHVYPEVDQALPGIHYKQINSLFRNDGTGRFIDVTKLSGNGFEIPCVGRGAAFADFDNDGFMDVVVANNGGPPLLLRNGGAAGAHFLSFKLQGGRSNRDALGARVELRAGGRRQLREISAGGSYLSHSDLRAHFGLGPAALAESVEVWWPSGHHQVFRNVPADKLYVVEEGKDQLAPQKLTALPARAESR